MLRLIPAGWLVALVVFPAMAAGSAGGAVSARSAFKATGVASRYPSGLAAGARATGYGFARARLMLHGKSEGGAVVGELAYEHRAAALSRELPDSAALPGSPGAEAPYRIGQLDWSLASGDGRGWYRHEIDRAFLAANLGGIGLSAGRQAVGWGRGALFSVVDVFGAFAPLEVDREWRRGIDAARAEVRLSDTSSAEIVGALADAWRECAVLGRVRGYLGRVDAEIIAGKRRADALFAATSSAAVGGAEVHAEAAVFNTPESQPGDRLISRDDLVGSAVAGGSYNFDVGRGLRVWAEYRYSGFGVEDLKAMTQVPDRLLRGDSQTLGRHAAGTMVSYEFSDELSSTLVWIANPRDASGVVSPRLTWDAAKNVSVPVSVQVPYGPGMTAQGLGSEHGASPVSVLAQVSVYY